MGSNSKGKGTIGFVTNAPSIFDGYQAAKPVKEAPSEGLIELDYSDKELTDEQYNALWAAVPLHIREAFSKPIAD